MNALIVLSLLAIVVLYFGLFKAQRLLLPVTLVGLVIALVMTWGGWNTNAQPIYSGMMLFDNFAVAFSALCIASTILILLVSKDYFERISKHIAEYYAIILFALAGVLVMVSFYNLSMLFIGVEIMSVSLYILVGIRKKDYASNEAALKYFLMGAFSTGFLLFGITCLYGATGSFSLEVIKNYVLVNPGQISSLFYSGVILMLVGLCFKIGVAPFHFWTPDVYEGAPTLITAFMSIVAKTAGFAALLRLFAYCLVPLNHFWVPAIVVIIILTIFIGNITAVYQINFKRMLAYSSISHAGYLLLATLVLGSTSTSAVFMYLVAYSIASVVAFATLILLNRGVGTSNFDDFNGLAKKNPWMAFALTVSMLSLAGIPLTAGFVGKFMLFSVAMSAYHIGLVGLAIVSALIGVFYYLRVIVAMYFKEAEQEEIALSWGYKLVFGFATFATILLGVYPNYILDLFGG
ncbi:MAG: NADH-quinone oxidoreductase subunit N [Sphingobacteriaceae bacterium]|nr:MAG: NADH-quinone oxidoreductase subunit N [Pedobacter sp.]